MEIVKGPGNRPEEEISRMIQTYEKDLLRLCCMYLKDSSMAEDAVQETFFKAYKNLHSFRGESSEKTWLIRIAVNVCRDMLRTSWFRRLDRRVTPEDLPLTCDPNLPDPTLAQALMALPLPQREVILLRYYQGLSPSETAQALNVNINTVKTRLARGKKHLKEKLEGWYFDET